MSRFKSGTAARLLLQVLSEFTPALHRHCPRCGTRRRFLSSGKFRVNAQKKRIDAWLIFRCATCDDRWNQPIHERRPVHTLDATELDALMRNDPDLAARHASAAAEEGPNFSFTLIAEEPATPETRIIEIVIAGRGPRLDRLLARALSLGRREIEALERMSAIAVRPATRKPLRQAAATGQRISIDLTACGAETAAHLRARASAQPPALYCATLSPR